MIKRLRFLTVVLIISSAIVSVSDAKAQLFRGRRFFRPSFQSFVPRVERFESILTPQEATRLENRLIAAANAARRRAGRRSLTQKEITGTVRTHSERMAANRDCFHLPNASQEVCAAWQRSPEEAIDSWLTSRAGHREELLNNSYRFAEAGVAKGRDGRFYWTLKFL